MALKACSIPPPPASHQVPAVEDIDKEQLGDPYANAEYAKEIFEYMRGREVGGSPDRGRGDFVGRATCCPGAPSTWGGAHLQMMVSSGSLTSGILAGEVHAP